MLIKVKRIVQGTLGLSKTEANAFLILIPLLFLIVFSEPMSRWLLPQKPPLSINATIYLDSLVASIDKRSEESVSKTFSLVAFDPNTATLEELNSLGIPERISKRIIQFRTKGGSFRIKSDLAKMYGMDSILNRNLSPFILLPDALPKREFTKTDKPFLVIQYDLNLADSTAFKSVKGIGSVLAKRIIKYRERLGGFVRLDQLSEVFGLDSLVIKELSKFYVTERYVPRRIYINRADEIELDRHPYISPREAKSIFTYRTQHGVYSSADELLKIKTISESTVLKIAPYLSFE